MSCIPDHCQPDAVRDTIEAAGRPMRFVRLSDEPHNEDQPWRGPVRDEVAEEFTAVAVTLEHEEQDMENSLHKRGSRLVLLAPGSIPENVQDRNIERYNHVIDEEQPYRIEEVRVHRPGADVLLYELRVTQ